MRQLTALHYEVLANPADTARRVELAKEQIRYRANDQAAYNLKRVDIIDDAALRRYQIDPEVIRGAGLRPIDTRIRNEAIRREAMVAGVAAPTTEGDLRLIAAGRVDDAIANLEERVRAGNASSRDHYALAKAYAQKAAPDSVRTHVGRALVLHAADGRLSAEELRELGQLVSRQD